MSEDHTLSASAVVMLDGAGPQQKHITTDSHGSLALSGGSIVGKPVSAGRELTLTGGSTQTKHAAAPVRPVLTLTGRPGVVKYVPVSSSAGLVVKCAVVLDRNITVSLARPELGPSVAGPANRVRRLGTPRLGYGTTGVSASDWSVSAPGFSEG